MSEKYVLRIILKREAEDTNNRRHLLLFYRPPAPQSINASHPASMSALASVGFYLLRSFQGWLYRRSRRRSGVDITVDMLRNIVRLERPSFLSRFCLVRLAKESH